jgi:hypothetical protein
MRKSFRYLCALFCALVLANALCGCATSYSEVKGTKRPFNFQTDTFAYANELVWEYHFDEHGKWVSHAREPEPDYTHHCFVVARSAKQFFLQAQFDANLPVADYATYRRLIRQVVSASPSHPKPEAEKIVIPGYADLHSFSLAQAPLLKAECGGAWESYAQHGHWRMIIPFSRHSQEGTAKELLDDLRGGFPAVVHVVRFPQLTINHAVVIYDAAEDEKEIRFTTYDPNNPRAPVTLVYDRANRTFLFAANDYFAGGRVDAYEVYRDFWY